MSRKINELSAQEVLALAIRIEQANGRRLRLFADDFESHDPEVAKRFRELAQEEDEHEEWLTQKFKRRFKGPVLPIGEFDVEGVVEAIEWEDSGHRLFDGLRAEKVFELAFQSEERASQFYQEAGSVAMDPSLALLFRQLAEMEKKHSSWIEKKIRNANEKTA